MAGKPNPRRALEVKLQNIAQMLSGNADSVGKAPDNLVCRNISLICLELEQAGKLARELQERDSAVAIEETRAELRTHVCLPAGIVNLPGLPGVAERCSPKLLRAYARLVTPAEPKRKSPGKPGRKADEKIAERNNQICKLAKKHGITSEWARLAELANADPVIKSLGLLRSVTRDIARNAVQPPKKRGTN